MKSLLILLLAVPFISYSQDKKDYIEVTGQAEVTFVPDLIYLKIYIARNEKLIPDLGKKEQEMIARLKNLGIDAAKDLTIKDLSSRLRDRTFAKDDVVQSKQYLLLVHDATLASKVMSELEAINISYVRVDHVDHSKRTEYKRECQMLAVQAARAKADALMTAIGQTAGRAVYVEEIVLSIPRPYAENSNANFQMSRGVAAYTDITDLDFDEVKLEYAILARFEIK